MSVCPNPGSSWRAGHVRLEQAEAGLVLPHGRRRHVGEEERDGGVADPHHRGAGHPEHLKHGLGAEQLLGRREHPQDLDVLLAEDRFAEVGRPITTAAPATDPRHLRPASPADASPLCALSPTTAGSTACHGMAPNCPQAVRSRWTPPRCPDRRPSRRSPRERSSPGLGWSMLRARQQWHDLGPTRGGVGPAQVPRPATRRRRYDPRRPAARSRETRASGCARTETSTGVACPRSARCG